MQHEAQQAKRRAEELLADQTAQAAMRVRSLQVGRPSRSDRHTHRIRQRARLPRGASCAQDELSTKEDERRKLVSRVLDEAQRADELHRTLQARHTLPHAWRTTCDARMAYTAHDARGVQSTVRAAEGG